MDVKGTAFLARRKFIVDKLGQKAWDDFVATIKGDIPSLGGIVLASALIPAKDFLRFQERLTRDLFNNDTSTYWGMGRETADWSLTAGPYKKAIEGHDLNEFKTKVPGIWRSFYNDGNAVLEVEPPFVLFKVSDLPIAHPYFEHVAGGFIQRALEMVIGKQPIPYRRLSGSAAMRGYTYQFGPI